MLAGRMPSLVKGAGFAKVGGNKPLDDDAEIFRRSMDAEKSLRTAVKRSIENPDSVRKGLNPAFTSQFGLFLTDQGGPSAYGQQLVNELSSVLSAELGKNITLTSPLSAGFVPYDLVAPSRLIYPVYSPLRNKIPRVPGQGTSHRAKLVTGVQGSQTGDIATARISIPEIPTGQSLGGNWPLNLPPSGSQAATTMNIPYKFFGLSESLSWLAQFAGQGFEDISALANLILLQEAMLGEEYTILSGTGTALTKPTNPALVVRAHGSNETPLSTVTSTKVYVKVTAKNYFGETMAQTTGETADGVTATKVVDVYVNPVKGAFVYNIYVTTGSSAGTYHLMASNVGAHKYTLQGVLASTGTTLPTADTGTAASTTYEGWLSVVDGHAATSGVYPTSPTTFEGGYINKAVGQTLSVTVVFNALQGLWDGKGLTNTSTAGSFRADPAELLCEGSDASRFAETVIQSGADTNYRLFLQQGDVGGVTMGAAVSEVQNPITRSILRLVVHPWLYQGTAFFNTYTLPMSWSNVSNVWENVMVQDYLSINWPVIDASFRYSLFFYGALVSYAPGYNGVLGGLQQSASTPYS